MSLQKTHSSARTTEECPTEIQDTETPNGDPVHRLLESVAGLCQMWEFSALPPHHRSGSDFRCFLPTATAPSAPSLYHLTCVIMPTPEVPASDSQTDDATREEEVRSLVISYKHKLISAVRLSES